MRRLYIASTEPHAGKTVIAAALAVRANAHGSYAAYLKPIRLLDDSTERSDGTPDPDATVVHRVLRPEDSEPSDLVGETIALSDIGDRIDASERTRQALTRLESAHDVTLLEGLSGLEADRLGPMDAQLARALEADVLLIAWYDEHEMGEGDITALRAAADVFGDGLAGLLINGVPETRRHHVEAEIGSALRAVGVPYLGLIPQHRILNAPTLGELVAFLGGEVVAFPEALDELAERIMLGALALDGGIYYYGQAPRKVVITRWDRPDLQMPALETGCQGLILTGGQGPIPYVWNRVQELHVPVAVVPGGTVATAARLNDGFLSRRGTPHVRKVQEMDDLLAELPDILDLVTSEAAPTAGS